VNWRPNGEVEVAFEDKGYSVIFDYSGQDLGRLQEQARRLTALNKQLQGHEEQIREIDLAFRRVAVVKMKDGKSALL
ncbi:MAG: hypothetical protein KDD53_05915, partial [Bdellovibrionales bacterium]|nr:hypothetical protein [Bdellovibrionales bacterium]